MLIAKLAADHGAICNEECAEALTRIGTPAVLHAIGEAYPSAEDHFRIYATEPLDSIHSDLAVDITLQLIAQEEDRFIRCGLATALLCQFAHEGIEIARNLLVGRELDFLETGLRHNLLQTCAFRGERFPEYDEWLAKEKAEREEDRRRIKELDGDSERLLLFAVEKLSGKKAADIAAQAPIA